MATKGTKEGQRTKAKPGKDKRQLQSALAKGKPRKGHLRSIESFLRDPDAMLKIKCARSLHCEIKRTFHRFTEVLATDVGFLVNEWEEKFLPEVGIRVHVAEKIAPELLGSRGLPDLSWPALISFLDRRYKLTKQRYYVTKKDPVDVPSAEREKLWNDEESDRDRIRRMLETQDKGSSSATPRRSKTDEGQSPDRAEDYRLYIESYPKESNPTTGEATRRGQACEIPIDIVAGKYFPSSAGLRVGPLLPNVEGFRDPSALELGKHRVEPLVGGVSIGNSRGSGGTLGAVVWDTTDGRPCLLSNWHVFSGFSSAQVGHPCYQPAIFDGGDPESDRVASLKRWVFNQKADAALAELDSERNYCPAEVLGLWHPIVETVTPHLGMEVYKWGRASGFCEGFVDGVDLSLNVEYSEVGFRHFEDQIHIAPVEAGKEVSAPGDSGALWVTLGTIGNDGEIDLERKDAPLLENLARRKTASLADLESGRADERAWFEIDEGRDPRLRVYLAVGLHFAGDVPGSPLGEHAVATPLVELSKELGFSFRPVFEHPDQVVRQPGDRTGRRRRVGLGDANSDRDVGTARQIDTGFRRRASGPQPGSDPVSGHP